MSTSTGGSFLPGASYNRTGATDTGGAYAGATLSGTTTVKTGATLTSPTLNGPATTVQVVSGSGATATLTASQSGATVLCDRAAGIVFTLPSPTVGLYYDFVVTVSVTSNAHKIITSAGTIFVGGAVELLTSASATTFAAVGNGSTDVSLSMNGTTTGGLAGTRVRFTCVSATLWTVSGLILGSGTLATPFATS